MRGSSVVACTACRIVVAAGGSAQPWRARRRPSVIEIGHGRDGGDEQRARPLRRTGRCRSRRKGRGTAAAARFTQGHIRGGVGGGWLGELHRSGAFSW